MILSRAEHIFSNSFGNFMFTSGNGITPLNELVSPYVLAPEDFGRLLRSSPQREEMMRGFDAMLLALSEMGLVDGVIIIGGSFVSSERDPHDIDVIIAYSGSRQVDFDVKRYMNDPRFVNQGQIGRWFNCNLFAINCDGLEGALVLAKWVTRFTYDKKTGTMRGLIGCMLADYLAGLATESDHQNSPC